MRKYTALNREKGTTAQLKNERSTARKRFEQHVDT